MAPLVSVRMYVPCYWLVSLSCVRVVAVVCSAAHAEPYMSHMNHDDALEVEPGRGPRRPRRPRAPGAGVTGVRWGVTVTVSL